MELSFELMKKIFELVDNSIVVTSTDLDEPGPTILYVNKQFSDMFDYTPEEVIGKNPRIFQGPETSRNLMKTLRKNLENREVFFGQTINYKRDGTPFYLRWHIYTVTLDNGEEYFVAVENDVTEWVNINEKLKRSNDNLQLMFDNLKDHTIYMIDTEGRIANWNESAERIKGYTKEEIIGQKVSIFFYDPKESLEKILKTALEKGSYQAETKRKRKNGEVFWAEVSITPIYDFNQNKHIGFLKSVRDITERHSYEEKIQKNLKEKETLLAEIHHRVKNNLQIMNSLLDLQIRNLSDTVAIDALNDSKNRLTLMAKLHQRIYESEDFSNIKLVDYIEDIVRSLLSLFGRNDILFSNEIDKSLMLPVEKCISIGLIFNELVTNSIKHAFSETSDPKIMIKIQKLEDNIEIEYSDNGSFKEILLESDKKSLGKTLINIFSKQLHAEIKSHPENHKGFFYGIRFKTIES